LSPAARRSPVAVSGPMPLEDDASLVATHDGVGLVSLRVIVRGRLGYLPDAWEASATLAVDACEEMRLLASEVAAFMAD
jgi:hypothetical protein